MKSYHLNKSFVIGIIVLFIGVGFQPVLAITPNTLENYEECSECTELSEVESAILKMQLIRLEKYTKLLLGFSRNNPYITEICEYLLGYINFVIRWRFPVICNIIFPKIVETLWEIIEKIDYTFALILYFIVLVFEAYYYTLCLYY